MATANDVLRIAAGELGYSRWTDPQPGTHLILPVAGNARTKEYNYDTLMGKWVCTTTNTSDTAKPDPCTLLLRARA